MPVKKQAANRSPGPTNIKFVQIVTQPYETRDGQSGSAIIALGSDGNVYRYYHSERAWIQMSTTILTEDGATE